MKKQFKRRKGLVSTMLSPLGIFAGLTMATIIAWNAIPMALERKYKEDLNLAFSHLDGMIGGVIGIDGFIDSNIAPCSSGLTTVGLNAQTLNDCNGFKNYDLVGTGNTSYYQILQGQGDGCQVSFGSDSTNNQQFFIYLDCDISVEKNKVIEKYFSSHLKKTFDIELQSADFLSTSLTNSTSGTLEDGKARFLFKK